MNRYEINITDDSNITYVTIYADADNALAAIEQVLNTDQVCLPSGFAGYAIGLNILTGVAFRFEIAR